MLYDIGIPKNALRGAGSLCHGWSAFPIVLYAKYRDALFGNTTERQEEERIYV